MRKKKSTPLGITRLTAACSLARRPLHVNCTLPRRGPAMAIRIGIKYRIATGDYRPITGTAAPPRGAAVPSASLIHLDRAQLRRLELGQGLFQHAVFECRLGLGAVDVGRLGQGTGQF